eukprot:CAMPEP_0194255246 /NCGR_PEP_ID=MMETSP0158-20130606/33907_1 /TAXON_ID=33649 /ORGANISM="Thalassionema nitzschioides, Strain L26-B" /LENGTH=624 /DNA_ID=CAMNT_0038993537 /DNA_START=116 /DNA_END=1987 /DNA_ORIENTATION=-
MSWWRAIGIVVIVVGVQQLLGVKSFSLPQKYVTTKQLFPYQQEGVKRLLDTQRLLLADEMGLGKTVQCIEALNRLKNSATAIVLVVCPKSVLGVWESEFEEWLQIPAMQIQFATAKSFPTPVPGSITLINYDICHKYRHELRAVEEYDVLICDEAHYLKSITSKRTLAILGDSSENYGGLACRHLWLLTGTPVLNRPVELYSLVKAIAPNDFTSFADYTNRYCDPQTRSHGRGRWSVDYSGARNLNELSQRLEPILLRRYKADVLTQLPPKFRSCLYLTDPDRIVAEQETGLLRDALKSSSSMSSNQEDSIQDFGSEASGLLQYLRRHLGLDDDDNDTDPETFNRLMSYLSTIRKETALSKLEPAMEILQDAILSEKIVVFAHHRQVIQELMEHFGNQAVCVMGGMDNKARTKAVRSFQNDPKVRLFIGSIRAAGVGVTLTSSSRVLFLEFDWSPGVMAQAEDRCHRVGQVDSVQVQYLVFKNTIDEWFARSLLFKQSNIEQILPETLHSNGETSTSYEFDFGKHKGLRLEDVPKNYVENFIIKREVWRKRKDLWKVLFQIGLVLEEPPSEEREKTVNYVFDFGKYKGQPWDEVPMSYRQWIVAEGVWQNRPELKSSLVEAGLV